MNLSSLHVAGFELVDTPASMQSCCLNLEEFDEASPMREAYCHQMTLAEYSDQTSRETQAALQSLMQHLDTDSAVFFKTIRRRKQEDIENAGMVSFIKARFLSHIQGDAYQSNLVSEDDCEAKLKDVQSGILKAFEYHQEEKVRRCSKRLAAMASRQRRNDAPRCVASPDGSFLAPTGLPPPLPSRGGSGGPRRPPPPPPPPPTSNPPPGLTPLKDSNGMACSTPRNHASLKRPPIKISSASSVISLQEELLCSNPLRRLHTTKQPRSPGGTPSRKRSHRRVSDKENNTSLSSLSSLSAWYNSPLNSSESLSNVLMRVFEAKFQNVNVRSPSPAPPDTSACQFSP